MICRLTARVASMLLAATSIVIAAHAAHSSVVRVEVLDRKPYQDGKEFPGVGAYGVIRGRAWFELDPADKMRR